MDCKYTWGLAGAVIGVAAGVAGKKLCTVLHAKTSSSSDEPELSTTSSGHSGSVYETSTAVSEYLHFHYGSAAEIMPYPAGPHDALHFAQRTGELVVAQAQQHGVTLGRCLDVGCAVGGTSFEVSKAFDSVVGVDFSHAFIRTANELAAGKVLPYEVTTQGKLKATHTAELPAGVRPSHCQFEQGDACNLRTDIGTFDVVHGANLLCRLPDPQYVCL